MAVKTKKETIKIASKCFVIKKEKKEKKGKTYSLMMRFDGRVDAMILCVTHDAFMPTMADGIGFSRPRQGSQCLHSGPPQPTCSMCGVDIPNVSERQYVSKTRHFREKKNSDKNTRENLARTRRLNMLANNCHTSRKRSSPPRPRYLILPCRCSRVAQSS